MEELMNGWKDDVLLPVDEEETDLVRDFIIGRMCSGTFDGSSPTESSPVPVNSDTPVISSSTCPDRDEQQQQQTASTAIDPSSRFLPSPTASSSQLLSTVQSSPTTAPPTPPPTTPTRTSLLQQQQQRELIPSSPLGEELGSRLNRYVYLITLSQADVVSIPTQVVFATGVIDCVKELKLPLMRWVAAKELHKDGNYHYHMAIHLTEQRKWKQIKNLFHRKVGGVLHFSSKSYGYARAYSYVTKSSPPEWITHSDDHEYMAPIRPQTDECMAANVRKGRNSQKKRLEKEKTATRKEQPQDLRHKDVIKLIVEKRVGTYQHLQGLAESRRRLEQWDLFTYLSINTKVKVAEMIVRVWDTMQAPEEILHVKLPRITVLTNAKSGVCVSGCDGKWRGMAEEIIGQNPRIDGSLLKKAVRGNIDMGRCKGSTVFLSGPKTVANRSCSCLSRFSSKHFQTPQKGPTTG